MEVSTASSVGAISILDADTRSRHGNDCVLPGLSDLTNDALDRDCEQGNGGVDDKGLKRSGMKT